jgi:Asp-tRNA(Asn)/Glu-tRNA(Gln) amidotransferase A subunit family amidase
MGSGAADLPAGLQIVTPWDADSRALSIGAAVEAVIGIRHADIPDCCAAEGRSVSV